MNHSVIYGFAASLGIIKGLQLLSKVLIAPGVFTDVVDDNDGNSDQKSTKDLSQKSADETKIQKSAKSQVEIS